MLQIQGLNCGYTDFSLQDINLVLQFKEFAGIIGPNGSGKTTLIRAITRLLKPKQGKVLFEGQDIWHIDIKELSKKIAVVSQNPPVTNMTVEEFVLLGRMPHFRSFQFLETGRDLEVAEYAMSLTGASRLKERSMDKISGGERQLALIARALAQEPRLLLLDEPTAHLDISHQVAILDLIKRLNKEIGLTVAVVLHDLNLAGEYCSKLVLMNEGRIHKVGSPEEVLDYRIIEQVYKTVVVVEKNPISSKPYVLVVSEEERQRKMKGVKHGK